MPTISIVLPTYNGARYIRQSVDSCLTQTFADFELIIINDCSTDNTASIIEEYAAKDARVKIVHNNYNKKLPISLNEGFARCSGKYFTWTSDDNYYALDALEKMINVLHTNPSVDLVYCDYFIVDANNKITGKRIFNDVNNGFDKWIGCGACFLYKSEIHHELKGYNPAAFLIEDYEFFTRAFIKFKFQYIPDHTVYFYREHSGSLTSTQANYLNNVAKIFLEKNISGLEKKISLQEKAILYRKLAIYYAVTMNNSKQYFHYLKKLRALSLWQIILTTGYVFLLKVKHTVTISFSGLSAVFKLIFKNTSELK